MALNRPYKNGLLLKGAYTFSKALNEVDDDGGGFTWPMPSQFDRNYALAGFDRPHMLQMGFVYELPFARDSGNLLALLVKNWQINGIASWLSGTPFTVGGDNGLLQQQGGVADDQRHRRCRARLRRGRAGRAVVRPDGVHPAGQRVGQQRPQRVPRTGQLEPRLLAVPGDPVRPLPPGDSRRVAERPQPRAVGQSGDRLHGPELHAHPCPRPCAAHGAARRAIRLLMFEARSSPLAAPGLLFTQGGRDSLPPCQLAPSSAPFRFSSPTPCFTSAARPGAAAWRPTVARGRRNSEKPATGR